MIRIKKHRIHLDRLSKLPILGEGVNGIVYKLNNRTCVKVNNDPEINSQEAKFYKIYKNCPLFPKYYGSGHNYLIMELIRGESLKNYLEKGGLLSEDILKQLVEMFEEGIKAGLELNPNARHIILSSDKYTRLIDIEDIIKFSSSRPYMLFNFLRKHGQKQIFLEYVHNNSESLISQWKIKL